MKAAARNGNDYAAYALGKEYLSGKYVVKNPGTAAEYLHQAAQADNPWAQYLLGKLHLMGEGVERDENAAYEWFQTAAEQGHTYAQFFVDRIDQQEQLVSPGLLISATRLLHHMGNIFRDNAPQDSTTRAPHIDHKRLQMRTPLKKCSLTADDGASPPLEWCTHSAEMVHGGRGRGAPDRHAGDYSGMPLRLRMDSPSIWMV